MHSRFSLAQNLKLSKLKLLRGYSKFINHRSIFLHDNHPEFYNSFISLSDQKTRLASSIASILLKQNSSQYIPKLNLLDIGCGPGVLTLEFARKVSPAFKSIKINCFDPSLTLLNMFEKKLRASSNNPSNTKYILRWDYVRKDGVMPNFTKNITYNFILASHVLYWIKNLNSFIEKTVKMLQPGGTLCVILFSNDGDNYWLKRNLNMRNNFKDIHVSAENFESILKNNKNIRYSKSSFESFLYLPITKPEFCNNIQSNLILEDENCKASLEALQYLARKSLHSLKKLESQKLCEFLSSRINENGIKLKLPDTLFFIQNLDS